MESCDGSRAMSPGASIGFNELRNLLEHGDWLRMRSKARQRRGAELARCVRVLGHNPDVDPPDRLGQRFDEWLRSRLIPHRHRPRAELQPAHELQVETLRYPGKQRRPMAR